MEYKSFMEALKGKQHKIDKNKNGQIDAHDFKLLRKEESELNEGTADELGDSIDNAKSTEHAKSIISKAPTKHLQYLHHWNMGLSGARTHKDMPHIKAELTSRKAVLSNAESSKRFDEQVDLEEATVKTQKYSWGTMKTVHHGSDFSIPLHPEHHKAIAKLKDQQEHKFKDETNRHWTAKRSGDDVHFHSANDGPKTTVKHSTMSEEVEDLDEIARMKTKLASLDAVSHMSVARQKLTNLMKSGKARGALIANKRRTLNMGDDMDQTDLEQIEEAKPGLYANIHAKKKRIEAGSGERMRKPGSEGAPSASDFKDAAKTANEEFESLEERNKENAMMRKTMDASRGARYKLNNPVPDADPKHKTARDHNVAIGRALRNEDKMTTQKDKNGKLISFKYEGDWKKSTEKKEGSGKAANLAGQAMQKMAKANEQALGRQAIRGEFEEGMYSSDVERAFPNGKASGVKTHAPVAPVPDKKYIKGTPENMALKASRKPINGMPTNKIKEDLDEANIEPTGAMSRSHIGNLSHPVVNSVIHSGKQIGLITKQPNGEFHAQHSAAKLAHAQSGTFDNKDKAHQFIRNAHAKAIKNGTLKANKVSEEKDEQEYGYEGDMALNQLATLTRCAEMIKEILKPDTDMPEWVQSKITLATDYIQTAADYMHSEMNEDNSVDVDKVNAAGDKPHEEKFETFKKSKKVKESFDDEGNLIANKVSYKEFMLEYTPGPGGVTQVKGRSYGASYTDPEGADDYDDKKPMKPAAEKRGRGRPAGAQSGARKNLGNSKLHSK